MRGDTTNLLIIRSIRNNNGISSRGWERGRAENSIRKTRGRVGKSGLLASERSNVSSVRNGNGISGRGWERGRTENSVRKSRGKSGLLASGKHTSRYGGFSSNGNSNSGRGCESGRTENSVRKTSSNGNNNTVKLSARNIRNGNNNKRGWVSENVSSVRNFRSVRDGIGIRGRVESGRGWVRGRA